MFCTWSAWQNPIVILTAPHSVRHVNGSAVCMWEGTGGGRGWIGAIVFEVGIWSSHLHLMPFRLLVLTRAKHLTQLGLIWWGHGMTPWPALSVFSKWNQLSHRVGERWREAERISALMPGWPELHGLINLERRVRCSGDTLLVWDLRSVVTQLRSSPPQQSI